VTNAARTTVGLFERLAFEEIALADVAPVTFGDGWTIFDETVGLRYVVGSTELQLKGKRFRVSQRLADVPLVQLGRLLESATPLD